MRRDQRASADGERTALSGFVPQYLIAAEKVLQQLNAGLLEAVILGDPQAGRLDDFQLIRKHEGSLRLDAYQVKWGDPPPVLSDSEFRGLLVDAVKGLGKIRAAQEVRRSADQAPIERFVAHIYSNRAPSQAGLQGEFSGRGLSVAAFLGEIWPLAAAGEFASMDAVPDRWRSYVAALAKRCSEEPERFLALARDIRFDLRQQLPEDKTPTDRVGMRFRSDVVEMAPAMKRLVVESEDALTLNTEEFLAALKWSERGSHRSIHQFPLPSNLKQLEGSIERLRGALDRHRRGYVFLFGSPGSGKSTLLTHALRGDPRIAARYYAFVPDHDSRTRGEASAFLHDLLLALRGGGTLLPPESDINLLRDEFHRALDELGRRALEEGRTALVLIDGLDHVRRDPKPLNDLLHELPIPEQVPDGVVIVLGTRRREDLPANVAAVARGERVIETDPLSRAAVLELASEAGVGESGERIFDLSEGHPLLTQTFIGLVEPLAKNVRRDILDSIEPLQGEIWPYYERIWAELGEDDDLLDALGVISRQRVPIDLFWLEETGTPRAAISRLKKLRHLFRELSSGRWAFFHDSFREFLRRRTVECGGKADPRRDQQIHGELAKRCLASEPSRPEAWESIHHLMAAGRPEEALAHATPSFYRAQYEALRPVPDVKAAIREAAAALHDCHRSDAVLNLALSAADAQGREYSYPEGGELAQVLVGLGEPDLAMAHVEHVDDHVVDRDRVRSAMGLVIALLDHGYQADAERFFDLHEPLQWLGGGGERRSASRGPWEALRAWARAAVLVRDAGHVIAGVRLLSIDEEDIPWWGEDFEEQLRGFRVDLLAAAAIQALRWKRGQDYAELLAAIDPDEPDAPDEIAECLLSELAWAGDEAEAGEVAERLDATLSEQLSPALRLRVARALFRFDRGAEAARQIETVPEPELPERSSGRDGDHEWAYLYSHYRLRAALGHRDSPIEAVPSPAEGRDTEVLVARHLIRQAELHGRLVAGEDPAPDELVRVVRSFHAFRDGLRKENRFGDYGIGELRTTLAHTAIAIAGEIGPAAVEKLWGYWEERWRDHEPEFLGQGIKLLSSFREAGLSETIIRSQLAKLEEAFGSRTDFEADDLVSLARAWLEFEESERARRCLAAAISHTGGVGYRKDHQLMEWVRLIEPMLLGPDAAPVARWLTEALISLNERVEATAPWEAARLMLRILASIDPVLALACGETLSEARILDLDEVLLKVLEGTATRATHLWWVMVAEVLVAVGSAPPREALALAVSASDDSEVAAGNLRTVCERVAIEGRPIQRLPWRGEILDAATELGLSSEDLGLIAKDLILGDETPSQSSYSDDSKDDRVDLTVVELIAELKDDPSDHSSLRAILRRVEELTSEQVTELDSLLTGTDEEPRFAVGLAKRAVAAGNTAEAWDQAERCLRRSASGDWQRHWAGGPVLDAVPIMLAIDAERGRRLAFERFATLASQDRYLLSEVGRSFEDYLQVLGPFDPIELSGAIWSYLTHLLARDAPTSAPAIARPLGGQAPELGQAQIDEALSRVIVLLLSSPYTLARRSGQRALSAASRLDGAGEILASLAEDPTVDPALLLAVLEARVAEGGALDEGALVVARSMAVAGRLDLRAAARGLLRRIGEDAPEAEARALPGPYELALQTPVDRKGGGDVLVGSGDLEEMVSHHRAELNRLAELAEVDVDLLHERVITLARAEGGGEGDDRLRGTGPFGWGFMRPSVRRVHHALARICGELFDARRVNPFDALRAVGLTPLYDPCLLACRPERRPAAIAPIIGHEDRKSYYSDWFLSEEPGPDRLATFVGGWLVIGESSHLALLAREYPEETRESALVLGEGEMFRSLSAANAEDQRLITPRFTGELILQRSRLQLASPDWWLSLHGTAAAEVGLVRDRSDPFSWRFGEGDEVVVRSLWWQSGYLRWAANSETDEVGEGWLVIVRPAVVERLTAAFGPLRLHWRIGASMRKESAEEPEVRSYEGQISDWQPPVSP